jgi:hypothetical protein
MTEFRRSACAGAVVALVAAASVSADMVYVEDISVGGQGLGAKLTILVMQQSGASTSGCVGRNEGGTADVIGLAACPEGFTGGAEQRAQTMTRTLGQAGILAFNELAVVLDVAQPGGATVGLVDMQARIWDGDEVCHVAKLDPGSVGSYGGTGVGRAGNVFVLDDPQVAAATLDCGDPAAKPGLRVGVAANLADAAGASESFNLARITPPPTPGQPAVDIEKFTNGFDADTAPGPQLLVGSTVDWNYQVSNIGDVDLVNVEVVDDQLGPMPICSTPTLPVGGEFGCLVTGVVVEGQYVNIGTVTATAATPTIGPPITVTDSDPSHYLGVLRPPSVNIEKSTNGVDADTAPGPVLLVGSPVSWTYVVQNTGQIDLVDVEVLDDKEGAVCVEPTLPIGGQISCTVDSTVQAGQYSNVATVTATAAQGNPPATAMDSDPSHYFGVLRPPPTPPTPIPALNVFGLGLLGLLLGGIGMLAGFRRRR